MRRERTGTGRLFRADSKKGRPTPPSSLQLRAGYAFESTITGIVRVVIVS